MPPGSDIGFVLLLAYSVFSWLLAPSALFLMYVNGARRLALGFLAVIVAVSLGRSALQDVGPFTHLAAIIAVGLVSWALMLAQFALPIYAVVILFDAGSAMDWLTRDAKRFGLLLCTNAYIVWVLAEKKLIVPAGTESWLKVGACGIAALGLILLVQSRPRVT